MRRRCTRASRFGFRTLFTLCGGVVRPTNHVNPSSAEARSLGGNRRQIVAESGQCIDLIDCTGAQFQPSLPLNCLRPLTICFIRPLRGKREDFTRQMYRQKTPLEHDCSRKIPNEKMAQGHFTFRSSCRPSSRNAARVSSARFLLTPSAGEIEAVTVSESPPLVANLDRTFV